MEMKQGELFDIEEENKNLPPSKDKFREIEIEMSDKEFLFFAKMAHEKDITFNQLINEVIKDHLRGEGYYV